MPEMSLREVVQIARQRFWWVAVPPALAVAAAVAVLGVTTPTYRATTTLLVTNASGSKLDYDSQLFNRNLAKTYVEVAKSRSVAQKALEQLGLHESPDSLLQNMHVSVVRDTELINIAVEDQNPDRAAALANTLTSIFSDEFQVFTSLDSLRVVDAATVPKDPVKPRPAVYLGVSLLGGLAAGMGLAFLRDAAEPVPASEEGSRDSRA